MRAEGNVVVERFPHRAQKGVRHPGHVDGETYTALGKVLLEGGGQPLDTGGSVFCVDRTDF